MGFAKGSFQDPSLGRFVPVEAWKAFLWEATHRSRSQEEEGDKESKLAGKQEARRDSMEQTKRWLD